MSQRRQSAPALRGRGDDQRFARSRFTGSLCCGLSKGSAAGSIGSSRPSHPIHKSRKPSFSRRLSRSGPPQDSTGAVRSPARLDGVQGRRRARRSRAQSTSDPLTPRPEDAVAGAIIREHERHEDGEKPSCAPMITSDCLFVLPFARPRESWQVAVLVALELAAAMVETPGAARSLLELVAASDQLVG
jgi:hypothetical protein